MEFFTILFVFCTEKSEKKSSGTDITDKNRASDYIDDLFASIDFFWNLKNSRK